MGPAPNYSVDITPAESPADLARVTNPPTRDTTVAIEPSGRIRPEPGNSQLHGSDAEYPLFATGMARVSPPLEPMSHFDVRGNRDTAMKYHRYVGLILVRRERGAQPALRGDGTVNLASVEGDQDGNASETTVSLSARPRRQVHSEVRRNTDTRCA